MTTTKEKPKILEKLFKDEVDFRVAKSILHFMYELNTTFGIMRESLLKEIKWGTADYYLTAKHKREMIHNNPNTNQYINNIIDKLIEKDYLYTPLVYEEVRINPKKERS